MANRRFWNLILEAGAAIINLRFPNSSTAPTSPYEGQTYFNATDKKFWGWNGTVWVDLSQVMASAAIIKGNITNANTNPSFPGSPVSGDIWFVTTTAGTVGGIDVEIGDQLIYGGSGWFVMQANTFAASETRAGVIEIATQAEANAGSDLTRALTPATLAGYLANYFYARRVSTLIGTLTANTATTVTHGLGVALPSVTIWQGNEIIDLEVVSTSSNAYTVQSLVTLSNVTCVTEA